MAKAKVRQKSAGQAGDQSAVLPHRSFYDGLVTKTIPLIAIPDPSAYTGAVQAQQRAAFACLQSGDRAGAVQAYEALLKDHPKDSKTANMLAALYVHLERYEDALPLLRQVMRQDPSDVIAPNNLAVSYMRQFKYDLAEKSLKVAVSAAQHMAEIQHNYGVLCQKTGRPSAALAAYQNALSGKRLPETAVGMAIAHFMLGQALQAEPFARAAADSGGSSAYMGHILLGLVLTQKEDFAGALDHFVRAVNLRPDYFESVFLFVEEVSKLSPAALAPDPALWQATLQALRYERVDYRKLEALWSSWVVSSPQFSEIQAGLAAPDLLDDPAFLARILPEMGEELFWRGLKGFAYASREFEPLLTAVRGYILAHYEVLHKDGRLSLDFLYGFAEHCFFTEYVFSARAAELENVERLTQEIAAGALSGTAAEIAFVLVGCYRNLYGSALEERALSCASSSDDPRFAAFVRYQVAEPREEQEIKTRIKRFGRLDNRVSQSVKAQYEENPYPRWRRMFDLSPEKRFILHRKSAATRPADILIAGCGTGRQVMGLAAVYSNFNLTAVDLSSSSLAYAIRKSRAAGLENVRYFMGDLLEIEQLGRRFDEIHCGGVLHHMADPMAGWQALTNVLRRGGVMRIALYSELARQSVVEARRYIAEHGMEATPSDIRAFRDYVRGLSEEDSMKDVMAFSDFFGMSVCRDLLFHVQEHRFTVPQIKAALEALGLVFEGFVSDDGKAARFQAFFGDKADVLDFDQWHEFEQAHPETFRSMYTFTCRKP